MLLDTRNVRWLVALVLAWQAAGCEYPTSALSNGDRTPFVTPAAQLVAAPHLTDGLNILACPPSRPRRATALIGPEGGTLRLGAHRLRVPPGAVTEPTTFLMTMTPGGGLVVHYGMTGSDMLALEQPVEVTLSYAACKRQDLHRRALRIVSLDSSSGSEVEILTESHDASEERITIQIRRLSTFAVAY